MEFARACLSVVSAIVLALLFLFFFLPLTKELISKFLRIVREMAFLLLFSSFDDLLTRVTKMVQNNIILIPFSVCSSTLMTNDPFLTNLQISY